jgi:hypothetical protein
LKGIAQAPVKTVISLWKIKRHKLGEIMLYSIFPGTIVIVVQNFRADYVPIVLFSHAILIDFSMIISESWVLCVGYCFDAAILNYDLNYDQNLSKKTKVASSAGKCSVII